MKWALPVLALIVALAGPACEDEGARGGFGQQPPPSATPSPAASASPEAEIREVEVAAIPGPAYSPDSLRVRAGETVRILLRNEDDQDHTFVVDELPVLILASAGQTVPVEVAVHPDRRGRMPFYCQIDGHRGQGMEGTLLVSRSG